MIGEHLCFDASKSDEEETDDDESEDLSDVESEDKMLEPGSADTVMSEELLGLIEDIQANIENPELKSFLAKFALIMGSN